jgi:regulator of sirC expression with transglutaminase-like and TPR domain
LLNWVQARPELAQAAGTRRSRAAHYHPYSAARYVAPNWWRCNARSFDLSDGPSSPGTLAKRFPVKRNSSEAVSQLHLSNFFFPSEIVDLERLSSEQKANFLSLLDDMTPTVRRALLAYFGQHKDSSLEFLKETAAGKNRALAWHARWFLEELKFSDPVAEFRGFIRSLNYELETGALLLSRTVTPAIDIGACCERLDQISARCRELIVEPMTVREKCRVLNRVLFHEYGFRGNYEHYTDPLNSLLDQVLERKKGIPISLCIVYLLVAHRLGIPLEPVGLPGHFVIGCYVEDAPFFVDAFEQGVFRSADDLFTLLKLQHIEPKVTDLAPTPVREVLCRCCRNLANHYRAAGDAEHADLFSGFVDEFEATYERHASP